MTVNTSDDPFERAVRRESLLRRRAAAADPQAAMRMIGLWFVALDVVWAVVLVGHWLLLGDPRWLVVLHTVVFALVSAFGTIAYLAQRHLARIHLVPTDRD